MDEAAAEASAHGRLECGACHKTATAPHDERLPAVNCAECHAEARAARVEGAHGSRRAQARAPAPTCVGCHDTGYLAFVDEWTAGFDKEATRAAAALKQAQDALRATRRKGRVPPREPTSWSMRRATRSSSSRAPAPSTTRPPPRRSSRSRAGRRRRRSLEATRALVAEALLGPGPGQDELPRLAPDQALHLERHPVSEGLGIGPLAEMVLEGPHTQQLDRPPEDPGKIRLQLRGLDHRRPAAVYPPCLGQNCFIIS